MAQVQAGHGPDEASERRVRIERLLAQYPALSERELAETIGWFEREASALDVALIASNERVSRGYSRFRAEHIDRFDLKDAVRAIVFVLVFGAAIAGVIWLAP